jgi:hypothetical protein
MNLCAGEARQAWLRHAKSYLSFASLSELAKISFAEIYLASQQSPFMCSDYKALRATDVPDELFARLVSGQKILRFGRSRHHQRKLEGLGELKIPSRRFLP